MFGLLLSFSIVSCFVSSELLAVHHSANNSAFTSYVLGPVAGCPIEKYHGIRIARVGTEQISKEEEDVHYNFGGEIKYECNVGSEDVIENELFLFPSKNRTCQAAGTWSSVPPICVERLKHFQSHNDFLAAIPTNTILCSSEDCSHPRSNWSTVGQMHPSCLESTGDDGKHMQSIEILVEFHRHLHLSLMTFNLPAHKQKAFYVEIKAPRDSLIKEFSEESAKFQKNHYKFTADDECSVIELGAYTNQVLVRFSYEDDEGENTKSDRQSFPWKPSPKFYPIPEYVSRASQSWDGVGCPDPPLIPKSEMKNRTVSEEKVTFQYDCQSGMILVDPITNMPSSRNQIWCHRRHEWAPYPFPVCRPFSVINSGDSYESKVDEPDDNSYGPVHYISAQLVEEALKILDELPREHTTKHVAMPVTRKPNGKYHMQNPDLMFQRSNSIAPAKNFLHVTFPKASPLPELEPLKENETSSVTWVTILTYIMGVLIVISTLAAFLTGLFLVPCIRQRSSLRGDSQQRSPFLMEIPLHKQHD